MDKKISMTKVDIFKNSFCNENGIIINLINNEIQSDFIPPILDVGCGLGDIAFHSLSKMEVIGIDVNDTNEYPLRDNHLRIKGDFLKHSFTYRINTLFIAHTMQFIDSNLDLLHRVIHQINPIRIILVANENDDFMGKLVRWSVSNFRICAPEVLHENFPKGYQLIKNIPFKARLECGSFDLLADQIAYLMLFDKNVRKEKIKTFITGELTKPEFNINQNILIYERR